jgi:NADP-dependent 3-hydroxy acid dehydrogenase YdfG
MSTDQNTGRVAVITGASSGIGEATARAPLPSAYDEWQVHRQVPHADRQ